MLDYVMIFRKQNLVETFGWNWQKLRLMTFFIFCSSLESVDFSQIQIFLVQIWCEEQKKLKTGHYPKFLSISLIFYHSSSKSQVKSKQRWLSVSTSANQTNFIKFQQISPSGPDLAHGPQFSDLWIG